MKIYRIYNPNRNYRTIAYDNTPVFGDIGENIEWTNSKVLQLFPFHWDDDSSKEICDCPFIIGAIPVFSQVAFNVIKPFLNENDVQVIPIEVDNLPFFILNVTVLLKDILNQYRSKIVYFKNGKVMDIEKYVFNQSEYMPSLFRISQLPTFTFVTENVAIAMTNAGLLGLELEECIVK